MNTDKSLRLEIAQNGCVVYEEGCPGVIHKIWAFESAETLSAAIKEWGNGNTRTSKDKGGMSCGK